MQCQNGEKVFKSIHIDLEKGIFLLNGKPMNKVSALCLEAEHGRWSLKITKDELYEAPPKKINWEQEERREYEKRHHNLPK